MRIVLLSILVFYMSSCSEHVELGVKGNNYFFEPKGLSLSDVKVEKWRVGPLRRQVVSKGITVQVSFPQLSRDDLETLATKRGVDSWLIKVRKKAFSVNTVLGYLYIPLIVPGTQSKNKYRRHQIKKGVFSVYYAAAAISKRFERFSCPAFDHNRYVHKFEIDTSGSGLSKVFAGAFEEAYVPAKVEKFSYSGNILNGGESIVGEYTAEIALYNHEDKRRKSNFVELSEVVKVVDERRENIKGCEGFQIPAREPDVDKTKLFRWKAN